MLSENNFAPDSHVVKFQPILWNVEEENFLPDLTMAAQSTI